MKIKLTTLSVAIASICVTTSNLALAEQSFTIENMDNKVITKEYLFNDFGVDNIEVRGNKRVLSSMIKNSFLVKEGQLTQKSEIDDAIKKLYSTNLFDKIDYERDGEKLVITISERPIISSMTIKGNSAIPSSSLKNALAASGIKEGSPLQEESLNIIANQLKQEYKSLGRFNSDVKIKSKIDEKKHTATIEVKIDEGNSVNISKIVFTGNNSYSKKQLLKAMKIDESSFLSFFGNKNKFSKPKIADALKRLQNFYLNEGYVNFTLSNTQTNISLDKKDVYVQIDLNEGKQFTVGDVSFIGNLVFDYKKLDDLVELDQGSVYKQDKLVTTLQNVKALFDNNGYIDAQVIPMDKLDKENAVVNFQLGVKPGNKMHVRRINFKGNKKTADDILRREMRQLESSVVSNAKLAQSKTRLMRTGYFADVEINIVRVPGVDDKVDIEVSVKEQLSGSTSLSVGFSQNAGVTYQAGLQQRNFFGTGNAVDFNFSRSDTADNYSASITDPFFTIDGITQTVQGYYRNTKADDLNINNYITDSYGAKLAYGYPVDENSGINIGLGYDVTNIRAGQNIALANIHFMDKNKLTVTNSIIGTQTNAINGQLQPESRFKAKYNSIDLDVSWRRNTLNRPVFPQSGSSHSVKLQAALPGSDVSFQKLTYDGNMYIPLANDYIWRIFSKVGYGNNLPFYKNYTVGGYGSLRGYRYGQLGPKSYSFSIANPALAGGDPAKTGSVSYTGGNVLVQAGSEIILPLIKGDLKNKIRTVAFIDGAQVFDTQNKGKTFKNTNLPLIIEDNDFRFTAGVSGTILTPIGPVSLSYSKPINAKKNDSVQNLQFEIGRAF